MSTHIADAVDVSVRLARLQKLSCLNHWLHHLQCSSVMKSLVPQPLLYLAQIVPKPADNNVENSSINQLVTFFRAAYVMKVH